MTVTRKRFSVSSFMAPEMDPMAQHRVLRLAHDHSEPSTCFESFSVTARVGGSVSSAVDSLEGLLQAPHLRTGASERGCAPGRVAGGQRGRTDHLGVDDVKVSEVDEDLAHRLVQDDRVRVLEELAHDLALVVLDDEDLWACGHGLCQFLLLLLESSGKEEELRTSSGLAIRSTMTRRRLLSTSV